MKTIGSVWLDTDNKFIQTFAKFIFPKMSFIILGGGVVICFMLNTFNFFFVRLDNWTMSEIICYEVWYEYEMYRIVERWEVSERGLYGVINCFKRLSDKFMNVKLVYYIRLFFWFSASRLCF